jgi:SAM-dependent methyltransferase
MFIFPKLFTKEGKMLNSGHLHNQTHNYLQFSRQYADLDIEGTYYLAFAEVTKQAQQWANRNRALDFGCGSGRSTRFLHSLGFAAIGVDVNPHMLGQAQQLDPSGNYQLLTTQRLPFPAASLDLIFQSFVLLEYSATAQMLETLKEFNRVLADDGLVVIITGSEEFYSRNWVSFQNDVPENQTLQSGEQARVSIRETDIVLFDYYWTDQDYRSVFEEAGFAVVDVLRPLAQGNEMIAWISELEYPCWAIYSLKKRAS